jgi:2-C-methyl-D-erythritol 4-phosphate cytidylyltransferase
MNFGVIVAAGKSERMGSDVDKGFLSLGTRPVLAYSLQVFEQCPLIDGVILVVRKERVEAGKGLAQIFGCAKVKSVVAGGPLRQVSVMNGLAELGDDVKIVAVHDGARPFVTAELIAETIKSAKRYGSGVTAVRITDTIKEVDRGTTVTRTIDRAKLWAVQTPQTFKRSMLDEAYAHVVKKGMTVTDEASAMELKGYEVHLVPGLAANIKITTAEDLTMASSLLRP